MKKVLTWANPQVGWKEIGSIHPSIQLLISHCPEGEAKEKNRKAAFTSAAPSFLLQCSLPPAAVPGALVRWPAILVRVTWSSPRFDDLGVVGDKLSCVPWWSWRAYCQQEAFGLAALFMSVVSRKVAWHTVVRTHVR